MTIRLKLPWPPSANNYKRPICRGGKPSMILTSAARGWKQAAGILVRNQSTKQFNEPVSPTLWFCPPDRRKRDLDNATKCTLDCLTDTKTIRDDSGQWMPLLNLRWCDPEPGGAVYIEVQEATPAVIAMLCVKPEWAKQCR